MDVELFRKNFFYGMDNKDKVIEYIILREADKTVNLDMKKVNTTLYRVEYTIQNIKRKIVQLYRFVYLNEPREKQTYLYNGTNENSIQIEELVEQKMNELKRRDIIVGAIKDWEDSAIYITGGDEYHKQYPGRDYYKILQQDEWIQQQIIPILEELEILEKENKEQYYALYLDTKYNRIINAKEQLWEEQTYLTMQEMYDYGKTTIRIEEIARIRQELPHQEQQIKAIFAKFMNSVKVSKQDLPEDIQQSESNEVQEYINKNFSDYSTISELKQEATSKKYIERLNKKTQELYKKIQEIEDKER